MAFWPDSIDASEIQSPREILAIAGQELHNRTLRLDVRLSRVVLKDRVVWSFDVYRLDLAMTMSLFKVSHRVDQVYPAVIDPPSSDIPEFLKRKRYVPGYNSLSNITAILGSSQELMGVGEVVENKWVCATPAEFRQKLEELFAKDHVTSRIVSLMAMGSEDIVEREADVPTRPDGDEGDEDS